MTRYFLYWKAVKSCIVFYMCVSARAFAFVCMHSRFCVRVCFCYALSTTFFAPVLFQIWLRNRLISAGLELVLSKIHVFILLSIRGKLSIIRSNNQLLSTFNLSYFSLKINRLVSPLYISTFNFILKEGSIKFSWFYNNIYI